MATEAQTCAIGIITILNILVALHLSRVLYKSTLFMQNKPNLPNAQMNVNKVLTKDYENEPRLRIPGKQTQTNPTCRGVASGEAGSNPISPKTNFRPKKYPQNQMTNIEIKRRVTSDDFRPRIPFFGCSSGPSDAR